jgi:hypothetical protein
MILSPAVMPPPYRRISSSVPMLRIADRSECKTTPSPLTSGFGALMELEYELRDATQRGRFENGMPRFDTIARVLWLQQGQLCANIVLLGKRYALLPHPFRFRALDQIPKRMAAAHGASGTKEDSDLLGDLIVQHTDIVQKISELVLRGADGQPGELILSQISHHHDAMVWSLTALRAEDEAKRKRQAQAASASEFALSAVGNWEAESESGTGSIAGERYMAVPTCDWRSGGINFQ